MLRIIRRPVFTEGLPGTPAAVARPPLLPTIPDTPVNHRTPPKIHNSNQQDQEVMQGGNLPRALMPASVDGASSSDSKLRFNINDVPPSRGALSNQHATKNW